METIVTNKVTVTIVTNKVMVTIVTNKVMVTIVTNKVMVTIVTNKVMVTIVTNKVMVTIVTNKVTVTSSSPQLEKPMSMAPVIPGMKFILLMLLYWMTKEMKCQLTTVNNNRSFTWYLIKM